MGCLELTGARSFGWEMVFQRMLEDVRTKLKSYRLAREGLKTPQEQKRAIADGMRAEDRQLFCRWMVMKPCTGYWSFFSKTTTWNIDRFLSEPHGSGNHTIKPRRVEEFQSGQYGLLQTGVDGRKKDDRPGGKKIEPGIYAIIEVIGRAKLTDPTHPHTYAPGCDLAEGPTERVPFRIVENLLVQPITIAELHGENLKTSFLTRPTQGLHCVPIEPQDFNLIYDLARRRR